MLEVGDGSTLHLRERENGSLGDENLVLGAHVSQNFVAKIALNLGGERVPSAEIAQQVDVFVFGCHFKSSRAASAGEGQRVVGFVRWGFREREEGRESEVWCGRGSHGREIGAVIASAVGLCFDVIYLSI